MSPVRVARPACTLTRAPQQLGTPVLLVFFTAPSTEWSRCKRSRLVAALAVPLVLSGGLVLSRAAAAPATVTVATDKSTYRRGEAIHVTVRNDTPTIVYVETGHSSCSVVGIQRRAAGRWLPEGICPPSGVVAFLPVAPGSALTAVLEPAPLPDIQGPIVGEPTTPGVSTQDLRTLPAQPPTPPSGPLRERTQGILPPGSGPGVPSGGLAPGTYRLELKVRIGSIHGPSEVTHSEEFVVANALP